MKAFLCHSSKNSDFVIKVAQFLKRNFDVYYYEDYQSARESFWDTIEYELNKSEVVIVFVGKTFTKNQIKETKRAYAIHEDESVDKKFSFVFCLLDGVDFPQELEVAGCGGLNKLPQVKAKQGGPAQAKEAAATIMIDGLKKPFKCDGLPSNPHIFSYEKDIINHFVKVGHLEKSKESNETYNEEITKKRLEGCPDKWPEVVRWDDEPYRELSKEYARMATLTTKSIAEKKNEKEWESKVGRFRGKEAKVIVAALTDYHKLEDKKPETALRKSAGEKPQASCCLVDPSMKMCFPEAGPRNFMYFPRRGRKLKAAILVSGGIAPGTNAVIDGIVQRHLQYATEFKYEESLSIVGIKNGFLAFENWGDNKSRVSLEEVTVNTSYRASEGGSLLGTSRVHELLADSNVRWDKLNDIVQKLYNSQVDILYIIGGDGSMKAAHALWTVAQEYAKEKSKPKLSVVAIPKTMDNDILWVWQTFGFLSAVEKAREIIEHLATEVASNPRLCVAQLFGSDSGFVVSHAVLASSPGQCDVALIPEIDFSIEKLAQHLNRKMSERGELIKRGLVVMAETAIPVDAMEFVVHTQERYTDIGLTDDEKREIKQFVDLKKVNKRRPGQTSDHLRSAGLKIVSKGLKKLLDAMGGISDTDPELRVVTNEPRHLLRALSPSCTDIIMGNRLGTLAVDNALAGYTDFMISQWLTEYVLVPLELVVLGRKRIPDTGIFWKSVIAKTGQPAELF